MKSPNYLKKKIILYFFNRWNLIDNAQIFMVYATIILKNFSLQS